MTRHLSAVPDSPAVPVNRSGLLRSYHHANTVDSLLRQTKRALEEAERDGFYELASELRVAHDRLERAREGLR